jgi:hypothetical protein
VPGLEALPNPLRHPPQVSLFPERPFYRDRDLILKDLETVLTRLVLLHRVSCVIEKVGLVK